MDAERAIRAAWKVGYESWRTANPGAQYKMGFVAALSACATLHGLDALALELEQAWAELAKGSGHGTHHDQH